MTKQQQITTCMITLLKNNNRTCVWYGDLELIEQCATMCNMPRKHPKVTIQRILNALEKSSEFNKSYIVADFNGYRRKYRCFILTTTP